MSTSHTRKSFYPMPPSIYPRPILDPASAYQTSYGREFGATQDELFFRSRTYNDNTPVDPVLKTNAMRDIYPKHGEAGYNLPYYRRDSKGFRVSYQQPAFIDDHYLRKTAWKKQTSLQNSLNTWAHPTSVPNYRDGPLGQDRGGRSVYGRPNSSQSYEEAYGSAPNGGGAGGGNPFPNPAFTGEMSAQEQQRRQLAEEEERKQRNAILNDPLLVDPLANVYRKSRTVYKRAFGKSR